MECRGLRQRKKREESGFVLVEGPKMLADLVQAGHVPETVVVTPEVSTSQWSVW